MAKMGTQSDVARELGISRQAVSKLISRRQFTKIPTAEPDTGLFNLDEMRVWYLSFEPRKGPRKGIKEVVKES